VLGVGFFGSASAVPMPRTASLFRNSARNSSQRLDDDSSYYSAEIITYDTYLIKFSVPHYVTAEDSSGRPP
jgi:hypothetical protein